MSRRVFEGKPAQRGKTPLLVGLVGPSGVGKTMSALRLATGMQRVSGGEIHYLDTEACRALAYADDFTFRHFPFEPPFGPEDYEAAILQCYQSGAGTIVVDSFSHEWTGQGGMLDLHDRELDRMAGDDYKKRDRCKMTAWIKPKAMHGQLISTILQLKVNMIFCLRAKEKIHIEEGKKPLPLGFQPIGPDDLIYELTLKCLMLPQADGIPSWTSEMPGERQTMKLPGQFRGLFSRSPQLSEEIGEALARWAAGGSAVSASADLIARYLECQDAGAFAAIEADRKAAWERLSVSDKTAAKAASEMAKSRIEAAKAPEVDPATGEVVPPEGAK